MQVVNNEDKGKYSNTYSSAKEYFATKTYQAYNAYKLGNYIFFR